MPRFEPHPERRPAIDQPAHRRASAPPPRTPSPNSGIRSRSVLAESTSARPIAEKIRGEGGEAFAHRLDVSDDRLGGRVRHRGREGSSAPPRSSSPVPATWSSRLPTRWIPTDSPSQVNVHLVGAQRLAHRVLPGMIERRRGDFVADRLRLRRRATSVDGRLRRGQDRARSDGRGRCEWNSRAPEFARRSCDPDPTLTAAWAWTRTRRRSSDRCSNDWTKWGFARHPYFLRASDIADAVVAVVSAPRGAHIVLVEVQPEAPTARRTSR